MAADEIERFRREIVERTGDARAGDNITDQELLREVMNTVGKPGQLGGSIRCVVSVSMLTEGWDANTVTHVLGIRAFGTQLLCEQVIGRALRRQSYDLNEEGLFNVEYADVFGIPFDFTAKPVVAPPQPPRETVQVKAVRPERDALEIRFPRVEGYRVELPEERLTADFNDDSILELTPDLVGPSITRNSGIIGEGVDLNLEAPRRHAALARSSSTSPSACSTRSGATPARSRSCTCSASSSASPSSGSTPASSARAAPIPAQLMYQELADMACNRITAGDHPRVRRRAPDQGAARPLQPDRLDGARPLQHVADRPLGDRRSPLPRQLGRSSTATGRPSSAASPSRIRASAPTPRTTTSGFEVPYRYGSETRKYLPDFIVLVDDGHGADDLLHLVVEIKGYRREDAKEKKSTMETYWVPGVNHLGHVRPLGIRRVHRRLPDRVRLQGQGRERVQQDDRVTVAAASRQRTA